MGLFIVRLVAIRVPYPEITKAASQMGDAFVTVAKPDIFRQLDFVGHP